MEYTYCDLVPFILWQLEAYGLDCSRKQIGEIVGCSVTTIKKYDDASIIYTDKGKGRKMPKGLAEKLKDFPFSNRQIKTWYDDQVDYIWIAGENGPYTKKKEKPEIVPLSDLTIYNPKLKHNNIEYIYPNTSGLYMLAQIVCIPYKLNDRYFLIKIGMSETNLNNRIKSYKGTNPFAICIDTKSISVEDTKMQESLWHKKMEYLYERMNNTEWFIVPYEDYLRFLEFGFDIKL